MDVASQLAQLEACWDRGGEELGHLLTSLSMQVEDLPPEERDVAVGELLRGLGSQSPGFAARVALLCGAAVESGAAAEPLGRAIVAPITRTLVSAGHFLRLVRSLPESEDEDAVRIGDKPVSRASIDAIHEEHPDAVAGFFSLDIWYRPAAAAWSRAPGVLVEAQAVPELRAALAEVGNASDGSYWLTLLLGASMHQPFVLLFPELTEAYEVTLDGVVDCGQLSVLLSETLAEPLGRVGASERADERVLAVMRGDGPQEDPEASFGSRFHLYPWQAMDPATSLPADGRFAWLAPGGSGSHSLPADFQPGAIDPLDGRRPLLVVGPNAKGAPTFVRAIGANRTFHSLAARLTDVRPLEPHDAERWFAAVRAAVVA